MAQLLRYKNFPQYGNGKFEMKENGNGTGKNVLGIRLPQAQGLSLLKREQAKFVQSAPARTEIIMKYIW